jgi:excisionase family DNA binding protein
MTVRGSISRMGKQKKYLTVQEAADFLGVTRAKVSQMLRDKVLNFHVDPLDRRIRLIAREDLQAILSQSHRAAA